MYYFSVLKFMSISELHFCFQVSELALEVAVLYYGGHLLLTGQLSSGGFISFFIYMLELGECFEVFIQLFNQFLAS